MEAKVIITTELQLKAIVADAVSAAFKYHQPISPIVPDTEPFGDFRWLQSVCPAIPSSTLRIKSSNGQIPGLLKFGKRVLYEKSVVLNWLRSQTRHSIDLNEKSVDEQINKQLGKKGDRDYKSYS